ncbi:MAG: hypothetical protein ABSF46_29395, partial [Terriglobia bacterium]
MEVSRIASKTNQSEIPRGVYPERQSEILRFARNDKRRAPSKIVVLITDPFRVKSVPVQGLAVSVRRCTPIGE